MSAPEMTKPQAGGKGLGKKQELERCPTPNLFHRTATRQETCFNCEYFRAVRLDVRLRTFCRLTGEKLRPDTPACFAWPGYGGGDAA